MKYVLTIVLLCIIASLSFAQSPTVQQKTTPSLEKLLNSDGTINTKSGFTGSLDPKGFRMTTGPNGEPRFVKPNKVTSPAFTNDGWDERFNPPGANGTVYAVCVGNECIIIGGDFTTVGGVHANHIAQWGGAQWDSMGTGTNGPVYAIAFNSGYPGFYVGGEFTSAGGVSANNIAFCDRLGYVWNALGSGANGAVRALAFDRLDHNLYVGGDFTASGGLTLNHIARVEGSYHGGDWHALGSGTNARVSSLLLENSSPFIDNSLPLYIGGDFTTAGGVGANSIAKWNGTTWSALGSGLMYGWFGARVLALTKMGSSIYAAGDFMNAGGKDAVNIARWDGSSWYAAGSTSGSGFPFGYAEILALATDGVTLYAGGNFTTVGGRTVNHIAQWNGTVWDSLGSGTGGSVLVLAMNDYSGWYSLIPQGTLCIGGSFQFSGGLQSNYFATWYNSKWGAAGNGMDGQVWAFAVSGNNIYAGGDFIFAGGVRANQIAMWNGKCWNSLGSGTNYEVHAIAVIGSDIYVGGGFDSAGGVRANSIAKWNGVNWSPLGNGTNGWVYALAVNGTDLYAGGDFTIAGVGSANNIAKWNGVTWSSLGSGVNHGVFALAVSGTDLYAGGNFITAGGVSANNVAKWNGASWSPLGSGTNGDVFALAVSGTDLYVGGNFTTAGSGSANNVAKWNGASWNPLGTGVDNEVDALTINGYDLYVGGGFTNAGGSPANGIARWDGVSWNQLLSGSTADGVIGLVFALATGNRADVYVGGGFPTAVGLQSSNIAHWGLGYIENGMIAGRVFNDLNKNGVQDAGEIGEGWVGIDLYSNSTWLSTYSDENGDYYFVELDDDAYVILVTPDPGYKQSFPAVLDGYHIEISSGNIVLGKNFGVYRTEVARYPLNSDAHDATGNYGDMILGNTPFQPGGGIYSDGTPGVTYATTPLLSGLDYGNLSIYAEFSISEYPSSGTRRPVFVAGSSSRWLGFQILSDGTVAMTYNNVSIKTSPVVCSLNDWHTALVTYDSTSHTGRFNFDGVLAGSAIFSLETFGEADKDVRITDGSIGMTFKGKFRNLAIYNSNISDWLTSTRPPSFVFGTVYNDQDGDGVQDPGEPGLAGWTVHLETGDSRGPRDTTTDSNGRYSFTTDLAGDVITVSEIVPDDWVQISPATPSYHQINISYSGMIVTGMDFGNKSGYRYIGPVGGNWSNPANWSGGHVPQPSEVVVIPVNVIVDVLPNDSILGLRILTGATLTFSATAPPLKLAGNVIIGGGGAIVFPSSLALVKSPSLSSTTLGMICYSDWINRGTFTAGHSTITFAGDTKKNIGATNFYNLEISGLNVSTDGNLEVTNNLILHQPFEVSNKDTVVVMNTATTAIQDTGRIIRGTIKRNIASGETGSYRFESPLSYVKFNGTGTYPSAVTITTLPDTTPPSFNLNWQLMGGVVDPVQNIVTFDSATHFSKWVYGIPRPTTTADPMSKQSIAITTAAIQQQMATGIPLIRRLYTINAVGGSNYQAQVRLRYDQSEVPFGVSETELRLLRGPFFIDSVQAQWNMVSLPLIPDSTKKDSVFPASSSDAFAYDGTYIERTSLNFGEGYWLKFTNATQVVIMGEDRDSVTIPVREGWNMVGAISYPISSASVASVPSGIITSEFFGYTSSYQPEDSLKPLHSYWVKTGSAGNLVLSTHHGVVIAKENSFKTLLKGLNVLTVSDAAKNDQQLFYGSDGKLELKRYDLPPVPPEGMFDVRYSTDRFVEVSDGKLGKVLPIKISSALYPITLHWQINDPKTQAWLSIGGKEVALETDGKLIVSNPDAQIQIRLSSRSIGELPKEFALYQNYPNPFNPRTTLKYSLPSDSKVKLTIYNVLGQVVDVLVDAIESAGYQTAEWNASNLASGVYFYRLETTSVLDASKSFTQVKKMLLLR